MSSNTLADCFRYIDGDCIGQAQPSLYIIRRGPIGAEGEVVAVYIQNTGYPSVVDPRVFCCFGGDVEMHILRERDGPVYEI